jgi:hypothetical protein
MCFGADGRVDSMQVRTLPATVEHLILVSAVPVAYPEVTHMEKFMTSLEDKNSWLVKTGAPSRHWHAAACPAVLRWLP